MNQLDQLKKFTVVVADTGDISSIKDFAPMDATTNPSLILKAAQNPLYKHLIEEAIQYAKGKSLVLEGQISHSIKKVFVNFGKEILKFIPGRVSIEIDSRLSYSISKTEEEAKNLIYLFEQQNIPRERILIKLAATWEGIQAAKMLEREKIHCNVTLVFSLTQAITAANANATIISPFVGRILDWHKKKYNMSNYPANEDPGVLSTNKIYHYYKKFGYPTQIMGASFRNKEQILELSGCDFLTISPGLLSELSQSNDLISCKLSPEISKNIGITKEETIDEQKFHSQLRENPMAFEKFHEGIEKFSVDMIKLEELIKKMLKELSLKKMFFSIYIIYRWTLPDVSPDIRLSISWIEAKLKSYGIVCLIADAATANSNDSS
jgi:transaldolase